MIALEVKNISKSFGNLKAVNDVTFSVPEGSIFGLIGRNGAGKTTTLRLMMGMYLPDNGEILLRGVKVGQEFRDRTGYLPEERGLYKKMKVLETLMFFAELKGATGKKIEQRAVEYLNRFDLQGRHNSKVEELSKGNQQKLQFIATILHDPDFVILDEPFSGLDPVNTQLLKEIILELKDQGKVIIFSTHLMDFAERMCDHLAMIDKGNIILSGSISEIRDRHSRNNVTIGYSGTLSGIEELPFVEKVENYGADASIRLKDGSYSQDLLEALVRQNVKITRFDTNKISLHEIFISLAGDEVSEAEGKK